MGFNIPPNRLSPAGRALFANTVFFALGAACDFNPDTGCSLLTSPSAIPSGITLDFDEWLPATVLGDLYFGSLGVRFEDNQQTRAITYADNDADVGKSFSAPNVATNSAIAGGTSAGVPMSVDLPPGRSHVGFRLGNGKDSSGAGPDISALITAFDVAGAVICRYQTPVVGASHMLFVGIYDAQSRIAGVTIDYGDTTLSESIDDLIFGPGQYADDIRLCQGVGAECDPVGGAEVQVLRGGVPSGVVLSSNNDGYLIGRNQVQFGDTLWARSFISATDTYNTYRTSGAPVLVSLSNFDRSTGLTLDMDTPLLLHNLTLSTQWDLTTDTTYIAALIQRIIEASNHLYDFTDGQMALGTVTVYQNYDEWNNADVRVYASNVLRPQAEVGGKVTAPTPDPFVPDHSYYPGYVYMGSDWDRTGVPQGTTGIDPDWSLALAHELGHYLLFLYDTYLSRNENNEVVEIDTCIGSAMGWAYEESNTEFVFDPTHWRTYCADTLANQILGRTEWETMQIWYAGLSTPTAVNPGPAAAPAPLTNVVLVPPSTPTSPITNQTFELAYQNQETASKVARGWLISNQRVLDQGRPISGTNTITLNNAQAGDRFCVFDIGDETSPRQFGCEIVEDGDNTLTLRKDVNWAPVIQLSPINTQTIAISVTQTITEGYGLEAALYLEDETVVTTATLALNGGVYTGIFNMPAPAKGAYVMVHVNEPFNEETPRREAIVGYGVGGSGAFGPASRLVGVPIISEDGSAEYAFDTNTTLAEGEYISWQSMAGSPGEGPGVDLLGDSYRLSALPASLAEVGTVAIRLPNTPPPTARSAAIFDAAPEIHFWTGTEWVPLESREIADPQGGAKVIAPSRG
ncbi:MAG: hypothetical protein R2856_03905 [Caldilineaceae bacterium]